MSPRKLVPLAALLVLPAWVPADTLLIEAIQENAPYIKMPGNGMTMEKVEKWFGPPEKKHSPVGDPPITRWDYPRFSVYFEYDRVITSVRKRGE